MSKKEKTKWSRVSRGEGAGSSDFLNQLEAFERGEIAATDVALSTKNERNTNKEFDRDAESRRTKPQNIRPQQNTKPKKSSAPLISDAYMEEKYSKKNKDPYASVDMGSYTPHGAPLIEEGHKRTRGEKFESSFQEFGIPLPGDDHTGFEPLSSGSPMLFPGPDGKMYRIYNGMVVPVDTGSDEPEPYNDISDILNGGTNEPYAYEEVNDVLNAAESFRHNMDNFEPDSEIDDSGVEEIEDENTKPDFTIEAEFEDIDGKMGCLTIADKHTTLSLLTSGCYEDVLMRLGDDSPLDLPDLNYICEHLDIPGDTDDYMELCWFLVMAIVFTRWPAVLTRNVDEVVQFINLHTAFPEVIYPSAHYVMPDPDGADGGTEMAILWQADTNFPDVLMEAANYFADRIIKLPDVPDNVIPGQLRAGFLFCVLEKALDDSIRWMPGYGDTTDGVPVEVEKVIDEGGVAKVEYGNTANLASGMMSYREMSIIITNLVLDFRNSITEETSSSNTDETPNINNDEHVESVQKSYERVDAPKEFSDPAPLNMETDAEDTEEGDSGDAGIVSGEDMASFGDSVLSAALGEKASSRDTTPIVQEESQSEDFTVPVRRKS